jgi:hypothetical protein
MYAASPASGSGAAGGTSSVDGADFYAVAALWFPDKWRCHKSVFLVAMLAQALRAARVAVDAQSRWWEADEAAQAQALEVSPLLVVLRSAVVRDSSPSSLCSLLLPRAVLLSGAVLAAVSGSAWALPYIAFVKYIRVNLRP